MRLEILEKYGVTLEDLLADEAIKAKLEELAKGKARERFAQEIAQEIKGAIEASPIPDLVISDGAHIANGGGLKFQVLIRKTENGVETFVSYIGAEKVTDGAPRKEWQVLAHKLAERGYKLPEGAFKYPTQFRRTVKALFGLDSEPDMNTALAVVKQALGE